MNDRTDPPLRPASVPTRSPWNQLNVPRDLVCEKCGYALRGHRADDRCPECGCPVLSSLLAFEHRRVREPPSSFLYFFLSALVGFGASAGFGWIVLGGTIPSMLIVYGALLGGALPFGFGYVGARLLHPRANLIRCTAVSWSMLLIGVTCFGAIIADPQYALVLVLAVVAFIASLAGGFYGIASSDLNE